MEEANLANRSRRALAIIRLSVLTMESGLVSVAAKYEQLEVLTEGFLR